MSAAVSCVPSPCVNVCRMDAETDGALCLGCFRTLDEIARWSGATDADKLLILAAIERRRDERARRCPRLRCSWQLRSVVLDD